MFFRCASYFLLSLLIWPYCLCLAGGIRFHTGMSLNLSVLTSLFSLPLFYKIFSDFRLNSYKQFFICLVLFSASVLRLYNSDLGLLVNYGCADAANHLSLYRNFINIDPKSYQGFNALYVSWYLFEKIFSFDTNFALYLSLLFPLFSICFIFARLINRSNFFFTLLTLCSAVILFETVILPIIHYNQADGYLAHLFSVSVILPFIVWAGNFHFLAAGFLLLCCRFSYGLQLPDLLVTYAIFLCLLALKEKVKARKILIFSLCGLSLIATYLSLAQLFTVFSADGSIISQNLDYAFAAQIVALAVLIQLLFKTADKSSIFSLLFLLSCLSLQSMWLFSTHEAQYYFSKLFLYSSFLMAVICLQSVSEVLNTKSVYLSSSLVMLIAFLIVAQRPYMDTYYERVQPSGDYKLISPLIDTKVKKIVNEVLSKESAEFAGYFTSRWGQFSYFNALFGRAFDFETFKNPPNKFTARSCLFWSKNSNDVPRLEKYQANNTIAWLNKINSRSDFKEVKYSSPWAGRQVIRYICFKQESDLSS